MKEQIIQLEPHDDVNSVRDKLGWLRAQRVLLVLPQDQHTRILQRPLDLVLIQREITRRRAHFALITDDPDITDHAHELGIPTFLSIAESHQTGWRSQLPDGEFACPVGHPTAQVVTSLVAGIGE